MKREREDKKQKTEKKLKITWKKQSKINNKKQSLASISNLPLEDEEEQPTSYIEVKVAKEEGEFYGHKTLDSSYGPCTQ